jgi:hypothetical protein
MKVKVLIDKYKWLTTIFWIIITATVTWLIDKSCDRIIPEDPVVVREVLDTIKIVHSYDFGLPNDSVVHAKLRERLDNIELVEEYENKIIKQIKERRESNSLKLDASFPNAKGYSQKSAVPYFSLNISSLQNDFIEIKLSFINESVLRYIYCLSLKIFKVERDKECYVLDEHYNVNGKENLIRIVNTLPKGLYKFSVGFTFKKDRNAVYPNVYQLSKMLEK